jgi:Ca2+-binding EF-hand superfamily protein
MSQPPTSASTTSTQLPPPSSQLSPPTTDKEPLDEYDKELESEVRKLFNMIDSDKSQTVSTSEFK